VLGADVPVGVGLVVGAGVDGDDVRTDGEGLGDTDRDGDVEVYLDGGADALGAEDVFPYEDAAAAEDAPLEADGDAAPEAVCPPYVGAVCNEVSAAGWDGTGVAGCPANEVSANAAAPEATRSAPRTHASTRGRHSRRRGRRVLPGGG
jgi:hypothetical protein